MIRAGRGRAAVRRAPRPDHRRQHRALRRDQRRAVRPRPGRRAVRGAQLGRRRGGRGRRRPRLRIHDRRHRRGPRPDRAQLRRRHVRRSRVRAGDLNPDLVNRELVDLDPLDEADEKALRDAGRGAPRARPVRRSPTGCSPSWDSRGRASSPPSVPRESTRPHWPQAAADARSRARDWRWPMPDPTGFLTTERAAAGPAAGAGPPDGLARGLHRRRRRADHGAGRPMYGLRHPVLPPRLPARQPIPDWNDLVRTGDWAGALDELHATNNFPEFTGRLCPAPCEAACVLAIPSPASRPPRSPSSRSRSRSSIVGTTPAWSRRSRRTPCIRRVPSRSSAPVRPAWPPPSSWPGPDTRSPSTSAMPARRRPAALRHPRLQAGEAPHRPAAGAAVGRGRRRSGPASTSASTSPWRELRERARRGAARLRCAGRSGHAGDARARARRRTPGDGAPGRGEPRWSAARRRATPIDAAGKHVIIIGGGDTAADCLGVAHRQGAAERHPARHLPDSAGRPRRRRATRGRPGRGSCGPTRPTKRAASGCSRSRSASSSGRRPVDGRRRTRSPR